MPKKFNQHVDDLTKDTQDYIESVIAYYKLDAYKKSAKAISALIRFIAFVAIFVLFFAFLLIGVSLYLGDLLHNMYLGFFCVALFNLLIMLFILTKGRKLIDKVVLAFFSEIFSDIKKED
ncbi:phage holin family protein [Psychroflexus salis]|uniref:Holin-X, holin superfamily III n=1 Tax=Psychroflexus salis TaxID=1526574 RepID=A0A916ZVA1_9FLAO|nr:phage holin family protein [Psychroflexus salis]GGE13205.1 hypothetical protein GCM10010831_13260 [Psychroflexus salis]